MKRKTVWGPSNPLYRWKLAHGRKGRKHAHYSGGSMARFRRSRKRGGSGGMGMGRLFSQKNLMFTLGAAFIGSRVLNLDPKLAGAAGGFLGAGPIGAIAGYFAAPFAVNALNGVTGTGSSSSMSW